MRNVSDGEMVVRHETCTFLMSHHHHVACIILRDHNKARDDGVVGKEGVDPDGGGDHQVAAIMFLRSSFLCCSFC